MAGKGNLDVEALFFNNTTVHYFPKGINFHFPNLKAFEISNCGLKEISREDLNGLEGISLLCLENNGLESLPNNLFEGMKKLKWISLRRNKLESLSSQLLQPFSQNQMSYVCFLENPSINVEFDASKVFPSGSLVDFSELMKTIDEKCKKPVKEVFPFQLFSDFTIITADQKFPVHRIVLSIYSSFFKKLFNQKNEMVEMKIEEFRSESIEDVLRLMYTGQIPNEKNAIEAFLIIMKFEMPRLKYFTEELIIKRINRTDAMEILELGYRYGSEKLKDAAFQEIKKILAQPNLNE